MNVPNKSRDLLSEFNIDFDQTLKTVFSELKGENIDELNEINQKYIIRQFYKNMNINRANTRKILRIEHELKNLIKKSHRSTNKEEHKLLQLLLESITDIERDTIAKADESNAMVSHIEDFTGIKQLRIIIFVSFILLMIIVKA